MKNKTKSFAAALAVLLTLCLVFMMPVGAEGIIEIIDYDSLKTAVDSADPGDTLTLTRDIIVSGDEAINVRKSLILDLNGHTISSSVTPRLFWINARDVNFTILGNGGGMTLIGDSTYGLVDIRDDNSVDISGVTLTLNGGTYTGNTDDGSLFRTRDFIEKITIDDVVINTANWSMEVYTKAFFMNDSIINLDTAQHSATTVVGDGHATSVGFFDNVTINLASSDRPCIEISGMTASLTDCTFSVTGPVYTPPSGTAPCAALTVSGNAQVTLNSGSYISIDEGVPGVSIYTSGGSVTVNEGVTISSPGASVKVFNHAGYTTDSEYIAAGYDKSAVTINGGSINGQLDIDDDGPGENTVTITGGTFSEEPSSDYVDVEDGCYVYENDGEYIVTNDAPELPTATISTNVNETLTFSAEFADAGTEQQAAYYKDWLVDFVLTINKDVSGENECYISGQNPIGTDWTEHELVYNTDDEFSIMTKVLGEGLARTVNYSVVKSLNGYSCGVFFPDEFLRNNTDLEVKIALVMKDGSSSEPAQEIVTQIFESPYNVLTFKDRDTVYHTAVLKEGDPISVPANPTRTGYNFVGWSGLPTTMPSSDLTVTADWDAKSYSPRTET
ncbi:MAG: hypothetical protein E7211_18670, partial [Clostridium lundense]|nr:hypothetical protein [Clostridium lundense]